MLSVPSSAAPKSQAPKGVVTPPPPQNAPASGPDRHAARGQILARSALAYRGLPYRFGGRSARTGFDCSGLVQTVYAKWGLYLPRVASAQIKRGTPVTLDKLLPGDLVFFKNTYKRGISHVGIYIGNHCFIHATRPGKGVVLSRLDAGYHKKHWAGARRLDLSKLPPVPGEEQAVQNVIVEELLHNPLTKAPDSALPIR